MISNRRLVQIHWGDCDPAGIVFNPRYFEWFDASTAALFDAIGLRKPLVLEKFGGAGIPVVDTRARFLVPSKYGDEVTIVSRVTDIRRSSFDVRHELMRGDVLAVEGQETRVWTVRDPADPAKLKSAAIPDGLKDLMSR